MTLMSRMTKHGLSAMLWAICFFCGSAQAVEAIAAESFRVKGVDWQESGGLPVLAIKGNVPPAYTMYELFSPHRLIIDIAQGLFDEGVSFPMNFADRPVSLINGTVMPGQNPPVARLALHLVGEATYSVTSTGNDIFVRFDAVAEAEPGLAKEASPELYITEVTMTSENGKTVVDLQADAPIRSYQSTEQAKATGSPARLLVDIADVKTRGHVMEGAKNSPVALVRTENYQNGTRVIVDSSSDELFRYSITSVEDGLRITVEAVASDSSGIVAAITGVPAAKSAAPDQQVSRDTGKAPVPTAGKPVRKGGGQDFALAGYTQQRISVDFYKIDLHNVFRLIGEISGRNIVVAEGVSGSLTLALNDVPWDFVLDVILNLKGLAKEERFNTIVISQKSDEFAWPQQEEEKLAIKQEALSVTKRIDVPKERLEARKIVQKGRDMEDSGNYAGAMTLYEKAFQAWPDNGDLARRIATIALARLGMSAKAAHYGQIASRLQPDDREVALLTAMALANLEKTQEARDYFDVAVGNARPSRQALASYAAFSEKNGSFDMALSLLDRYESLYGTSLETLVSKARIYDKTGDVARATEQYRMILLSGYQVPADLEQYIQQRLPQ
ncbi:MAG: hypothetical protein ACOY32_16690 [Thermodesulfobacteriota bacterium]